MNLAGTAPLIHFNEELSNGKKRYRIKLVLPLSHVRTSYPITIRFLDILLVILQSVNNSCGCNTLLTTTPVGLHDLFSCQSAWLISMKNCVNDTFHLHLLSSFPSSFIWFSRTRPQSDENRHLASLLGRASMLAHPLCHLCLYYGVGKHVVSISPIKPPQPLVSFITYRNLHAKPFATIVTRTVSNSSLSVSALIDSGSAGNLISETLHPPPE